MGAYRGSDILVAVHSYGSFSTHNKPLVVDGVWRGYSVLERSVHPRRTFATCISVSLEEVTRQNQTAWTNQKEQGR